MLKQSTRERLQTLVQDPGFEGSVHIIDKKIIHTVDNGKPAFYVDVDIHGEGLNVFTLLAELFPDMKVTNIREYSIDHGETITYGNIADGKIEGAHVNIWARYGEKVKEKALRATGEHL
jgi:hypothetical protein